MTFTRKAPHILQEQHQTKLGSSSGLKRKSSEQTADVTSMELLLSSTADDTTHSEEYPYVTAAEILQDHGDTKPDQIPCLFKPNERYHCSSHVNHSNPVADKPTTMASRHCQPPQSRAMPPKTKRRRFSSASAGDPLMKHAFSTSTSAEEQSTLFSSVPPSHKSLHGLDENIENRPPKTASVTNDTQSAQHLRYETKPPQPDRILGRKTGQTNANTKTGTLRGRATYTQAPARSHRNPASIDTIALTFPSPRKPPKKRKETHPMTKEIHNKSSQIEGGNPEDATPPFFSTGRRHQEKAQVDVDVEPAVAEPNFVLNESCKGQFLLRRKCLGPRSGSEHLSPQVVLGQDHCESVDESCPSVAHLGSCPSTYCQRCIRKMVDEDDLRDIGGLFGAVVAVSGRIRFPTFLQMGKLVNSNRADDVNSVLAPSNRFQLSTESGGTNHTDMPNGLPDTSGSRNTVFKSGRLTAVNRARMINFMIHCQSKLPHPPSPFTLHVGVSCFDRFCVLAFSRGDKSSKEKVLRNISAVAIASLHLASKVEDVWAIEVEDLVAAAAGAFTIKEILIWERRLLHALDFRISIPTALDFALSFLSQSTIFEHQCSLDWTDPSRPLSEVKNCSCDCCTICGQSDRRECRCCCCPQGKDDVANVSDYKSTVEAATIFLIEFFLTHPSSLDFSYELIAAAALYLVAQTHIASSQRIMHLIPPQCTRLFTQSNDSEEGSKFPQTLACMICAYEEYIEAEELSKGDTDGELLALVDKYVNNHVPKRTISEAPTLFDEAFKEPNEKLRETKLAAYLIQAAYKDGQSLAVATAKQAASKWIQNRMIGPHGLLTEKQPPAPPDKKWKQLCPLGLFAADVVTKHKDVANQFYIRFNEWKVTRTPDNLANLKVNVERNCSLVDGDLRERLNDNVLAEPNQILNVALTSPVVKELSLTSRTRPSEATTPSVTKPRRRTLPARNARGYRFGSTRKRPTSGPGRDSKAGSRISGRGRSSYMSTQKFERVNLNSAAASPNIETRQLMERNIMKSVGAISNSSVSTSEPLQETPTIDMWSSS